MHYKICLFFIGWKALRCSLLIGFFWNLCFFIDCRDAALIAFQVNRDSCEETESAMDVGMQCLALLPLACHHLPPLGTDPRRHSCSGCHACVLALVPIVDAHATKHLVSFDF